MLARHGVPVDGVFVSVMANGSYLKQTTLLSSLPNATWKGFAPPPLVSSGKTVAFSVPSTSTLLTKQLSLQGCNRSVSLEVTVPKNVTFDWLSVVLQSSYAFVTALTLTAESVPFEWIQRVLTYDNFPSLKTLNVRGNVDALLKALKECNVVGGKEKASVQPVAVKSPVTEKKPAPVAPPTQPPSTSPSAPFAPEGKKENEKPQPSPVKPSVSPIVQLAQPVLVQPLREYLLVTKTINGMHCIFSITNEAASRSCTFRLTKEGQCKQYYTAKEGEVPFTAIFKSQEFPFAVSKTQTMREVIGNAMKVLAFTASDE